MGIFDSLPTLAEQGRCATPKHKIVPRVIEKEEKRKTKAANAETFRAEVWKRDEGRSRATGEPLVKSGTTDPHRLGEVDHSIPRSLAPERVYDVANGILLSKWENRARKVACPEAPEFRLFDHFPVTPGATDCGKPRRFVWRDKTGRITKERIG